LVRATLSNAMMDFSGGRRIVVYSLDIGWSKFIADGHAGLASVWH
jgi:hypothetical protein